MTLSRVVSTPARCPEPGQSGISGGIWVQWLDLMIGWYVKTLTAGKVTRKAENGKVRGLLG